MAKKGKKYSDSVKLYEKSKQYDPAEAMGLVCKTAKAKFDETVEIHVRLGVDSRHADQQVRGAVVLPNGTGKIEYRLDKTNIIHCPIGKVSFGEDKLRENFDTLVGAIIKAKPASAKGQYIKSCVIASTMGPGIKINQAKLG